MSIFRRLIWWSSKPVVALGLGAALIALGVGAAQERDLAPFLDEFKSQARTLPLFLDDFHADRETPVSAKEVAFGSAVGQVRAYWARPDRKEALPAVLLVYDDDSWNDWMRLNTRQMASIGYETLTINIQQRRRLATSSTKLDEAALAELSAAVRWLRGRADVLPNRLGVVGWHWSGSQVLALAAALPVQACVVCEAHVPDEPTLKAGLRETPILGVFARADQAGFRKRLACKIHVADHAQPGFLGPPDRKAYAHDAAEDAWVAIYNFLEKHVEDLRPNVAPPPDAKLVATIADIMRAVNEPAGLRGAISKGLEQEPTSAKHWDRIRANAALIAEAGGWLERHPPPKGSAAHWKEQARLFGAAAETIAHAADRRDLAAARRGLAKLADQCAACHHEHR